MTLDQKFEKYHKENPHVYALFVKYARQVKASGYGTYGMHTIMHRVRWHINIETHDPDGFKMNNNYSSRYARMIMEKNPDLDGLFRTRRLST